MQNDCKQNDSQHKDTQQNDIQKNDIQQNDIQQNDILQNVIMQNYIMEYNIMKNDVQKNNIMKNDIHQNDTHQNVTQRNDTQQNGTIFIYFFTIGIILLGWVLSRLVSFVRVSLHWMWLSHWKDLGPVKKFLEASTNLINILWKKLECFTLRKIYSLAKHL